MTPGESGDARTTEAIRRRTAELFATMRDGDAAARAELIELHLPLAEHCARRFRDRGESWDDLVQVATIGLIKSVDRFETGRGVEFSTYATPTIIGELKRHFRDRGWALRVPRRLQELRAAIGATAAELTQSLGRSPTPAELADRIGCTVDDVVEGLESGNAYATVSLDTAGQDDDGTPTILDTMGEEDANFAHAELRASLAPLLSELEPRERRILLLRFVKNMSQSQIAAEVGISQMHVSRLLGRTLERLREAMRDSSGGG